MADEESSVESDVVSDTELVLSLEKPVSGISVQSRLKSLSDFWICELDSSQFAKDAVQSFASTQTLL